MKRGIFAGRSKCTHLTHLTYLTYLTHLTDLPSRLRHPVPLVVLGCMLFGALSAAERAKERSVEALAESLRPSIVVVSHFGRDGKEDGMGAGFVVSSNGLIATSLHVIGEARPITVQLANGKRYEATEVHA